ncbi:phage tail protein [Vibrio cholerae]|nr:phage tail protein [Vibrio cholerae]HDI3177337.1 phage tail protein [Vibrio cholerae]
MSTQYQAGYKFIALREHIESCVGENISKRLQTEMVDLEIIMGAKHQGNGVDLFNQLYDAEFYFDRFPFKEYSPAKLFAQFVAWLMDNDPDREELGVPDPAVSITVQSETEAIIVVTVGFEEPVKIQEDINGDLEWCGKKWRVDAYPIHIAEKLIDVVKQ